MPDSLVHAHERRYLRGKTPEFAHDRHQLIVVSTGLLAVERPEARWVVPAGHAAWVPARTRCSLEPFGPVQARLLHIRPDLARRPRGGCEVLRVEPLLKALVDHLVAIESLHGKPADRRLVAVLADQIAGAAEVGLRLPSPRHPRALRVAKLLETDPSETASLIALGRELSLSARTLARLFVSETGVTLGQWRRQFLLMHALMLAAKGLPVKAVALDVGYESPSAFVAAFKRALGTTPGRLFKQDRARR